MIYPSAAFLLALILHAAYSIWQGARVSQQWVQIDHTSLLTSYLQRQDYFLGLSYALAAAFTVYAFRRFLEVRRSAVGGVLSGVALTGILYFGGCFLLGCCGSPMLAVYLALFGSSFLGFAKPLVLTLTMASVLIGYFCIERKAKSGSICCEGNVECRQATFTTVSGPIQKIHLELEEAMSLAKCRMCGRMKQTLEDLRSSLPSLQTEGSSSLLGSVRRWLEQMQPIKYADPGCEHCQAEVAMRILANSEGAVAGSPT